EALAGLLAAHLERRPVVWVSDGYARECAEELSPWPEAAVVRRHEPTPRLIVVGGDPTALAIAQLGAQSEFEPTLVRPKGPAPGPPIPGVGYSRADPGPAFA